MVYCTVKGWHIVNGSADGLPKFHKIIQLCIVKEQLCFIVKDQCAWYREHFGAFEQSLSTSTEVGLIEPGNLKDPYPLSDYMVGRLCMVILKRFIIVRG